MLYKIFHNVGHPMHSVLPNIYIPPRLTRRAAGANNLAFSSVRFNTNQYSRSFIPAVTKLWNDLPNNVVELDDLQKFKVAANAHLLRIRS